MKRLLLLCLLSISASASVRTLATGESVISFDPNNISFDERRASHQSEASQYRKAHASWAKRRQSAETKVAQLAAALMPWERDSFYDPEPSPPPPFVGTAYFTIRSGNWNNNTSGQTPWATVSCAAAVESLGTPTSGDTVTGCNTHTVTIPVGYTATVGTSSAATTFDLKGNTATTTFVVVNNGTLVYQTSVQIPAAWSAGPGAHFQADSSLNSSQNYIWQYPTGCTACNLLLSAAFNSPITWDAAPGSGNPGYIGVPSSATPGRLTANWVNWSNLGTATSAAMQMSLNASGDTFSVHNSTCTSCSTVRGWKIADGSNLSFQNFIDSGNVAGSSMSFRALAFGEGSFLGARTSGVREIVNSYFGGIGAISMTCASTGLDPGFVIQGTTVNASGTSGVISASTCAMAGLNWSNNLLRSNAASQSGAISHPPGGTVNRTYFLGSNSTGSCSATNLHLMIPPAFNTTVDGWIAESDCGAATGSITGKFIDDTTGSAPFTHRYTNSIVLKATAGPGGSASTGVNGKTLAFYVHGSTGGCNGTTVYCPVVTTDHNTAYAVNGSGLGLYAKEGPTTQAPLANGTRDSIYFLSSPGPMTLVSFLSTAANGTFVGAGYNWRYNDNGAGVGYQTANANVEYATPSTPGTGDTVNVDPQFTDSTRNFLKWCQTKNPSDTTWDQCIAHFADINATANGYTPYALIEWVRAGFAPQNSATTTADSTGGQIGAVRANLPTAPLPAVYYTDLVNGMCAGGLNNRGHIVTIDGKNFGSGPDGSHFVTMIGPGGNQPAAAYLLWTDTKISFQPGCTYSNGDDISITVTTPNGTSAQLPFHIYTGGTIYFVDQGAVTGVVGNDTTNNGTAPATPYLTLNKCIASAKLVAGNACYIMPGYVQASTVTCTGSGTNPYACLYGVTGTASAHISVIGYPIATVSQVAQFGWTSAIETPITVIENSKYLTLANVQIQSGPATAYENIRLGSNGGGTTNANHGVHHIRVMDVYTRSNMDSAGTAFAYVYSSFVTVRGVNTVLQAISPVHGKHVVPMYIADSSHDIDVGYSTFDGSCAFASPPCKNGKQLETHVTVTSDWIPTPPQPTLTPAGSGSLAAGTYDVKLSYGSHIWYIPSDAYFSTESMTGASQSVALDGVTQTAISVTNPPGFQRPSTRDDGVTVIDNPTLNYRVYACLRSDPVTPCTNFFYQGASSFTNTDVYDGITGSPYTLSSLATSGVVPPTCQFLKYQGTCATGSNPVLGAIISGSNIYNVAIHDNLFLDSTDYSVPLGLNIDANSPRYFRFFNNVFVNGGNTSNDPGGTTGLADYNPQCLDLNMPDGNAPSIPAGGLLDVYNNTFFNCGSLTNYNVGVQGAVGLGGIGWHTTWPTLTLNMQNNIIYQPQVGQYVERSGYINSWSNLVATGSTNICYNPTNSVSSACPVAWNSAGNSLNVDPRFTNLGNRGSSQPYGGAYWTDVDLSLLPTSPAIGAGVDRGLGTTIGARLNQDTGTPTLPTCSISPTSVGGPFVSGAFTPITFGANNCTLGLSWSATGLAGSGLSLDPSTGVLSGTSVAGTYPVHILYDTADATMTITVTAAPSVPTGFMGVVGGTRK